MAPRTRHASPAPIRAAWISSDGYASVPGGYGVQAGAGVRRRGSGNSENRREESEEGNSTRSPSWDCLEALTDLGSLLNLSYKKPGKGSADGTAAAARPNASAAAGVPLSRDEEMEHLRSERDGLRAELEATEQKRKLHSARVLEMATRLGRADEREKRSVERMEGMVQRVSDLEKECGKLHRLLRDDVGSGLSAEQIIQVSTEGLRAELSSVEEEAEDREPAASPLVFLEPELAIPLLFLEEGTDRDAEHEREKWRGPWKVQDEMALSHDTPHGPTTPEEAGLGLQTQQGQGAEEAAPLSREQPGHLQGEGHVQGQGGALDRGGLGVCHREEGGLPQGGGKGAGERVVLGALNLSRQGGVGGEVCRGGSGDGQQGGAPGGVERSGCLLERVVLGDLNLSLQAPLARFGDALCPKAVAAERWRRQALDSRTRRIFEL